VQVESRLGEGSTFTVTLPYGDRSGYEADEGSTQPDMATSHDATPVILLVEDSEDTALVVSDYLAFVGMDVISAVNGLEAVTKAGTASPDLILMDIQMPQMDGLEAIRRIRSSGGEKRVPIIAVTALAMPGDRERCMEAGADGYMSKPLSLQELVTTIRSMLDNGPEGNPLT
jgi:CheY-like chemotaxis protein